MKYALTALVIVTFIFCVIWTYPLLIVGKEQFGTYQYAFEELRVLFTGILFGWGSIGAMFFYYIMAAGKENK